MIKVIDIDNLFDEFITEYVYANVGKVKPEEIENKIPQLYEDFGKKPLAELDGKTPKEYYRSFGIKELLDCLKNHLEQAVSVPDFLCEAITSNSDNEQGLVNAITEEVNEEFTIYVMNMLNELNSKKCLSRYLEFVLWDYSCTIKELATEHLKENANSVKEDVLAQFNDCDSQVQEYLSEILSGCKKDDRVFNLLTLQFVKNLDKIPLYASYLSKYGDERALPFLMAQIEREDITYADFEELRFAIEALGGEYNKVRDFKKDKSYKKIKNAFAKKDLLN